MSLVFTNLGNSANPDFASTSAASSYSNSSWTPPTSGLIFVFVRNYQVTSSNTPTISGNSLTWTQIATYNPSDGHRITLFGANASGSSTGATTVDFSGQAQVHCAASFFMCTGADLSGGVAAAFVQTATNEGSGVSSLSITLSAPSSAANRPISGFYFSDNEFSVTPRTGWTEMDELSAGTPNVNGFILETQVRENAFETTASASTGENVFIMGMAAEIKEAGTDDNMFLMFE